MGLGLFVFAHRHFLPCTHITSTIQVSPTSPHTYVICGKQCNHFRWQRLHLGRIISLSEIHSPKNQNRYSPLVPLSLSFQVLLPRSGLGEHAYTRLRHPPSGSMGAAAVWALPAPISPFCLATCISSTLKRDNQKPCKYEGLF